MSIDERIGQNLAIVRGDTSQKELADRMRERGFKWSQATVWSIEHGERPLRLSEAQEVADILMRPLDMLLAQDGEAVVHAATRTVAERYNDILKAMEEYDEARGNLALALDAIPDVVKGGWLRVSTDWVGQNVDRALEDYRQTCADEFAAMLARDRIDRGLYFREDGQDRWRPRFNRALDDFRQGVERGVDQTEA